MDKKLKKKSLCKWAKEDVKNNPEGLYELLSKSKYMCGKCLRSSRLKGTLCEPEKLVQKKEREVEKKGSKKEKAAPAKVKNEGRGKKEAKKNKK